MSSKCIKLEVQKKIRTKLSPDESCKEETINPQMRKTASVNFSSKRPSLLENIC